MHSVFVISSTGSPLTPTTAARARRLLRAGGAEPVWSKFGTFGIRLLTPTSEHTPDCTLGYDGGTKFEGFAVVCGRENSLSIKLDLPDKQKVVQKVEERRTLRRARRFRNTRRRPARFHNRRRNDFLAPSQRVIVDSRLKVLHELLQIYPIRKVGIEDVRFNHARHRWGANFSTVEIGKTRLHTFVTARGVHLQLFAGHETQLWRDHFGYRKGKDKAADCFEAHCSDALALACAVGNAQYVAPGPFLVVDDTYRCVRRKLHDTQPAKGGVRAPYSRGNVRGLRKGLLIGAANGKTGHLCGINNGGYRYYDVNGQRQSTKGVRWISSEFVIRKDVAHSSVV